MYFYLFRLSIIQNASYSKYYHVEEKVIGKYSKAKSVEYFCRNLYGMQITSYFAPY
jgi:hypothetical protein